MGRRVVSVVALAFLQLLLPAPAEWCAAPLAGGPLLLGALPCLAEPIAQTDPPSEILTDIVDTLEVVAERPEPIETLSTFATVHDVADRAGRVSTVAEVIEEGTGVHVRRYGGLGAYSTASIRASSPGQVEVYLDGMPLQSGQWGVTNLADLPLDNLDRIEVYRGGAPVGFGTPGIGGLVNLVTHGAGEGRLLASVSAGSYGTWEADLLNSGGVGPVDYAVSYHHLRSEGDFDYLDRHGTPENPEDDEIVARENNGFRQSDLMLKVSPPPWRDWRFELADDLFWKASGVPGIENVHIKSVHYEIFRNIARISLASPPLAGNAVDLEASAFHQYRRDLFFNPDDEVGFNRSDTDNQSRAWGASGLTTLTWHAARQALSLFGEVRQERFVPEDMNPRIGVGFTRKRTSASYSAEDKVLLLSDRLELLFGYRYQEAVDNFAGPVPFGKPPAPRDDPHWSTFHGPSLGLRWKPHPRLTVKANRARYGRFPTMMELFGASGTVEGNPELSPEEGTNTDVGVVIGAEPSGPDAGFLEATLFWCDREDLITFLQNSQRTVKAFNLESAHVEGVEVAARRSWRNGLGVSASYTLQEARNTGPSPTYHGKRLPYEPRHALFVRTGYEAGRFSIWHEYRCESEAYRDRANLPENLSPATHLHNVGVGFQVISGIAAINAEVKNVSDERVVDVEGYPLPGRTFFVTLVLEPKGAPE